MKLIIFFSFFSFLFSSSFAQYEIKSPYLQQPERAIGYADSCARFWFAAWDDQRGGFFSDIDKYGNPILQWGGYKHSVIQSRNAYGMVRAFMLTGDTEFLDLAGQALDYLYTNCWDSQYGGWFNTLDINGNVVSLTSDKPAFDQHYALLGPAAFFEAAATGTEWDWLMTGYDHLENTYWDSRGEYAGYFDLTDHQSIQAANKSFNATVDAVTTHLLYLYLMTADSVYADRLQELAGQMIDRLTETMPDQAIGFAEYFDSNWNVDPNNTMTIMGHVLKTAWCLARIHQLLPDPEYISTAESLFVHVHEKGYDQEFGGPYKDYDRTTGEMLMWGNPDTAKAWWQMEQAVTAGLQLYDITGDTLYLKAADETLDFFMKHFVDHAYGEVYADRTRYGGLAWNENKGGSGKGAYHSVEMGYYTYLYGNLFVQRAPVTLHYYFSPAAEERTFHLSPLALSDYNGMKFAISDVMLDSEVFEDYDAFERLLNIPADVGGHFEVTFDWMNPSAIATSDVPDIKLRLYGNYPNPFNPVTTIRYNVETHHNASQHVIIAIYNVLGEKITTLVSENQPAGEYAVRWDATGLPTGVYFCRLETGDGINRVHKMLLVQ